MCIGRTLLLELDYQQKTRWLEKFPYHKRKLERLKKYGAFKDKRFFILYRRDFSESKYWTED